MTEPNDFELLELAAPFALHAMPEHELADIEQRVAAAPAAVTSAFHDEVRGVRETMALMSAATAVEPPVELRARLLAAVEPAPASREKRWPRVVLAAAAIVAVGLAALGVGIALRPSTPEQQPSTAAEIFAAPDVRTTFGQIPTGGTATRVYSPDRHAGVLVMNGVAKPQPGTVYQMWLVSDRAKTSAGVMDAAAVAPSTTAVLPDLGDATALAFTVEPGSGSPQPTSEPIAILRLS